MEFAGSEAHSTEFTSGESEMGVEVGAGVILCNLDLDR